MLPFGAPMSKGKAASDPGTNFVFVCRVTDAAVEQMRAPRAQWSPALRLLAQYFERAARDAKPRRVLADSPFDVPGPMLSPECKPRTKARMTTTKTSRSLEDENASLRDELARAREDLMAERARAE